MRRFRPDPALAMATLLLTGGCSSAPMEPAPEEPAPPAQQACPENRTCDFEMQLGIGLYDFKLVEPGQDVPVTLGPQGGFHVWLATRCQMCSPQVIIEYGVRGSAGGDWLVGQPLRGIANLDEIDTWYQATGLYGLLPGDPDTVDYLNLSLELEISIEDDQRRSSRVLPVRVASVDIWDCPDSDPEACR